MRASFAVVLILLTGCAVPPPTTANAPPASAYLQKYQIGEKRYLSRYSDMMLWDGPPAGGTYQVFGTGTGTPISATRNGRLGLTIESYTPPPNEGYVVKLSNGKRGWVKELDLLLSDSVAEHRDVDAAEEKRKAECKRRGGVGIGMTAAQVKSSCWGAPRSVNRTITAHGTNEQWVYGGNNYIYLINGIVSAIQN